MSSESERILAETLAVQTETRVWISWWWIVLSALIVGMILGSLLA